MNERGPPPRGGDGPRCSVVRDQAAAWSPRAERIRPTGITTAMRTSTRATGTASWSGPNVAVPSSRRAAPSDSSSWPAARFGMPSSAGRRVGRLARAGCRLGHPAGRLGPAGRELGAPGGKSPAVGGELDGAVGRLRATGGQLVGARPEIAPAGGDLAGTGGEGDTAVPQPARAVRDCTAACAQPVETLGGT